MHWEIRLYIGSIIISPLFISLQWGTVLFDGSATEKTVSLPLKINNVFVLTTFAYGSGVHSTFGGWHQSDKLYLYRHAFNSENVNCVWFGLFI